MAGERWGERDLNRVFMGISVLIAGAVLSVLSVVGNIRDDSLLVALMLLPLTPWVLYFGWRWAIRDSPVSEADASHVDDSELDDGERKTQLDDDDGEEGCLKLSGMLAAMALLLGGFVYFALQKPKSYEPWLIVAAGGLPILLTTWWHNEKNPSNHPTTPLQRATRRVGVLIFKLYGLLVGAALALAAWVMLGNAPPLDLRAIGIIIIVLLVILIMQNANRR